jgi:hypothetical protein
MSEASFHVIGTADGRYIVDLSELRLSDSEFCNMKLVLELAVRTQLAVGNHAPPTPLTDPVDIHDRLPPPQRHGDPPFC